MREQIISWDNYQILNSKSSFSNKSQRIGSGLSIKQKGDQFHARLHFNKIRIIYTLILL